MPKRTREALYKFVGKSRKDFGDVRSMTNEYSEINYILDALIKEGWVELDEPREWVLIQLADNSFENYSEEYHGTSISNEIIHVREVIDND